MAELYQHLSLNFVKKRIKMVATHPDWDWQATKPDFIFLLLSLSLNLVKNVATRQLFSVSFEKNFRTLRSRLKIELLIKMCSWRKCKQCGWTTTSQPKITFGNYSPTCPCLPHTIVQRSFVWYSVVGTHLYCNNPKWTFEIAWLVDNLTFFSRALPGEIKSRIRYLYLRVNRSQA